MAFMELYMHNSNVITCYIVYCRRAVDLVCVCVCRCRWSIAALCDAVGSKRIPLADAVLQLLVLHGDGKRTTCCNLPVCI